jgi:hypothetical protein
MQDDQDRKGSIGGGTFALTVAAVVVVLALIAWGPWESNHVASNPGPSGTPGSTVVETAPPPADSPSDSTTGSVR